MYREQQVRAGMALLDEKNPGWEGRINLDWLDVHSGSYCVLGQLYRIFDMGVFVLGITCTEAEDYGFYLNNNDFCCENYAKLTDTWKTLIGQRLGKQEKKAVPPDATTPPTLHESLPFLPVLTSSYYTNMQANMDRIIASMYEERRQQVTLLSRDEVSPESELVGV